VVNPDHDKPAGDDVKVGWVDIAVDTSGAAILIDGKVPPAGPQGSYEASPGVHDLEVSAPGHETYNRRIRVARGQKRTLTVKLRSVATIDHDNKLGYVLFGVAAVAGATGIVFGFLENDAYEDARDAYEVEQQRPAGAGNLPADVPESHVTTRAEYDDMRDKADRYALVSNISYGVAAVALGVSIYYFVQARPLGREGFPMPVAQRTPRLAPTVLAGGAGGVGGGLTFTQEIDW
jgi:hypothetical protein